MTNIEYIENFNRKIYQIENLCLIRLICLYERVDLRDYKSYDYQFWWQYV